MTIVFYIKCVIIALKYNFNRDKMPRVTHVKAARKDNSLVKKGEPYYWWKFRYGGKRLSKTYPKRSQLTQSNFYSQLWDLEDDISGFTAESGSDAESAKDEFAERIRDIGQECQDSLDNMPESLQYSPTGELLQERIDAMESMADEMEGVDCDVEDVEAADTFETPQDWQDAIDEHESAMDELCSMINEIQYEG